MSATSRASCTFRALVLFAWDRCGEQLALHRIAFDRFQGCEAASIPTQFFTTPGSEPTASWARCMYANAPLDSGAAAGLAMKRKAHKALSSFSPVLIRDASDDRYPYPDPNKKLSPIERRRWKVFRFEGCHHDGIWFTVFRAPAYIADDGEHWDYAEGTGRIFLDPFEDPWRAAESEREDDVQRVAYSAAMTKWDTFNHDRAWLEEFLVLPYDNILALDEEGDDVFKHPQIYVAVFDGKAAPFLAGLRVKLETIDRFSLRYCAADPDKRVEIFDRLSSGIDPPQSGE
jgi:hypothetical protein